MKLKLIRFLYPIPKFLDQELNTWGAFRDEDVCNINESIANLLIEKGRCEVMENATT